MTVEGGKASFAGLSDGKPSAASLRNPYPPTPARWREGGGTMPRQRVIKFDNDPGAMPPSIWA